ncbi:VOC family protein [Micromonospora orduensis]|uniref:VOC family protein n=1 Tax=Micromonospora orduensis TaxID=1420891 RepID=UPI001FCAFD5F|nr:VOC family protein [Micromonospora orduensis]
MEFYHQVFGGQLRMNTFGEFGSTEPGLAEKIMHAMLESPDGLTLMASDTAPGMKHQPGTNIAVSLSGDNADELRGYWEQLAASGTVSVPLEKQMWGDEYGQCVDRYGINWMVNIAQSRG